MICNVVANGNVEVLNAEARAIIATLDIPTVDLQVGGQLSRTLLVSAHLSLPPFCFLTTVWLCADGDSSQVRPWWLAGHKLL